ncbi:hypothetical protein [Alkalihalobacillus deserti]|uniref:hypothetical protein n=1 Tax=Alkalihalobacillus deserti TaxID=2879466 RepID=UPI001D145F1B|nr:hypothetical protein [Alkalihalobacillus deserti]
MDSESRLIEKTTNITPNEMESVIEKEGEDILETSGVIEAVDSESRLIEKTTNITSNEMESVIEEVGEVVSVTKLALTDVEQILLSSGLTDNLGNLRTDLIKPDSLTKMAEQQKEPKVELKEKLETTLGKRFDEESEEASSIQYCHARSAIVKEIGKPKHDNTATTSAVPGVEIKVEEKKSKTSRESEPNNIPVPMEIMASYIILPYQSKQCLKKSGSHFNSDATLHTSIHIKICKRHLVNHAKLIASNRANEPPKPPPKHSLFSNSV